MSLDRDIPTHDLLGRPLDQDERELVDIYRRLQRLAARDDLAPCTLMNVRQALVMLWNVMVDLDLAYDEPGVD